MGRLREYLPARLDDFWYEHVDMMDTVHKSYIVDALFVNMAALLVAWTILGGNTVVGAFGTLLMVSFRYQFLAKINNLNYMTGEYNAERKMKDTMAAYLLRRNIGIRFYYVGSETKTGSKKTHLKWRISDKGRRGKAHLKIALFVALLATLVNPGWYYQLEQMDLDHHRGIVSAANIEEVRQDVVPVPEVG